MPNGRYNAMRGTAVPRRCANLVAAAGIMVGLVAGGGGTPTALAEVPQTTPGIPMGWGANSLGAFGAPTSDGPTPVPITAESGSTQVSMGCSHALYLHSDGTVWASGWNNFGQLGDGSSESTTTATQVLGLTDVVAVAAGCYHSLALESDGTVWLWGQYQGVTTSNPPDGTCPGLGSSVPCFLHPTQWVGPAGITQIAAGTLDEVALATDGTVYAGGQIGNAHLTLPNPATDIAMQSYVAEAITSTGQVYQWGNSSPAPSDTPTVVPGITGFATALAGGGLSGYAVTSGGTVWAWGDDRYGQLGNGGTASESTAIQVPGLPPVVAVAAGFWHGVALASSGGVWAWGDNLNGEVGPQQPEAVEAVPSQVPGIDTAIAITAGGYSTIALIADKSSTAVTGAASSITQTSATLNATVNPNGSEVSECKLEYGTTASYGATASCSPSPGSGESPVDVTASITGLSANTTYHFRIVAANAGGASYGSDQMFTTLPDPPVVVTGGVSALTLTSATLNATVNPNGGEVSSCEFEYGTTNSYGTSVPCGPSPGAGEAPVAVSATLNSLAEGVTYHYRISATNAGGLSRGSDETFATVTSGAPEFGRCVKVPAEKEGNRTVYRGSFTAATCLGTSGTHTGKYEWYAGVAKTTFTSAGSSAVALETGTKAKVTCTAESGRGSITSAKTLGSVVVSFTGCESSGHKCMATGLGEGELESAKLEGVLGFEDKGSKKVALDLYPVGRAGVFAQYVCNGSVTTLTGSVLVPIVAGKMSATAALKYKASKGKQKPEGFEGAPADVLMSSLNGGASERDGLTLTATQTYEEEVEINPAV
jgi:alpha-tubulin suppressor-like RCC1 family protein